MRSTARSDPLPRMQQVLASERQKLWITTAASQSQLRVSEIAAAGVSSELIDELRAEVARLAADYVHLPLWSIFDDIVTARDLVFDLLDQRQRPADARELFFLGGAACLLLAHASHNLGDRPSAFIQLRSASVCAEAADRAALHAWRLSTEALINDGLAKPQVAAERAAEGLRFSASGESHAMLAGIKARALARLGNRAAALAAVGEFEAARSHDGPSDDVCDLGGVLSFPHAKQEYYLGSIHGLLGSHARAEQHAGAALAAYESGPAEERSYGDEALARLDIVNARLWAGDFDGGAEALAVVLTLPEELRIRQLGPAINRTRAMVVPWARRSRAAGEMLSAVDDQYGAWGPRP